MDRGESDPCISSDNGLGAVAVVRVEIPDRDAFRAAVQRVERGHRDVIEEAKTHRLIAGGVMPGGRIRLKAGVLPNDAWATAQAAPEARAA